jgi:hypothetical protein
MDSALPAPLAHAALAVLAIAPLLVQVPVNANIVLTAAITVLVGCWRSVKPEPPAEAMTKKVRGTLRVFPRNGCHPRRLRRCRSAAAACCRLFVYLGISALVQQAGSHASHVGFPYHLTCTTARR